MGHKLLKRRSATITSINEPQQMEYQKNRPISVPILTPNKTHTIITRKTKVKRHLSKLKTTKGLTTHSNTMSRHYAEPSDKEEYPPGVFTPLYGCKCLFDVLGYGKHIVFEQSEFRMKWRQACLANHPDKSTSQGDIETANQAQTLINLTKTVLGDKKERDYYVLTGGIKHDSSHRCLETKPLIRYIREAIARRDESKRSNNREFKSPDSGYSNSEHTETQESNDSHEEIIIDDDNNDSKEENTSSSTSNEPNTDNNSTYDESNNNNTNSNETNTDTNTDRDEDKTDNPNMTNPEQEPGIDESTSGPKNSTPKTRATNKRKRGRPTHQFKPKGFQLEGGLIVGHVMRTQGILFRIEWKAAPGQTSWLKEHEATEFYKIELVTYLRQLRSSNKIRWGALVRKASNCVLLIN